MSVLALKALDYGAEKIPDRLFEKIPGGFFTPGEKKNMEKKRHPDRERRHKSEQRRSDRDHDRRRAERERSPPTDYSDHSAYDDSDYERELRRKERRRRARSLGRSISRSLSRGRHHNHRRDQDLDDAMDRAERAERGPHFDPPPTSEYRPYDPRDYASPPPVTGPSVADGYHDPYDRRASSARPDYGYPPQVNTAFRSRSATVPLERPPLSPSHLLRPRPASRTPSRTSMPPLLTPFSSNLDILRGGTPLGAAFSPSYEPPLAALLSRQTTNLNQPPSATAARYTPVGYAPSPVNTSIPPPTQGYAPYNPADYAPPSESVRGAVAAYAAPPALYRQRSNSQPSLPQYPYPDANAQLAPYVEPLPIPHGSSASSHRRRHGDGKHHRARSAGHHGHSQDSVTDKVRDRFENLDLHDKNLAASVGGALAGGFAGQKMGHGTLSTLIGAGIGAFGGREMEKRLDK